MNKKLIAMFISFLMLQACASNYPAVPAPCSSHAFASGSIIPCDKPQKIGFTLSNGFY